jgi:hypothetical protein
MREPGNVSSNEVLAIIITNYCDVEIGRYQQ